MSPMIAVCVDIIGFQGNRVLDKTWIKNFPGVSWVSIFAELIKSIYPFVLLKKISEMNIGMNALAILTLKRRNK